MVYTANWRIICHPPPFLGEPETTTDPTLKYFVDFSPLIKGKVTPEIQHGYPKIAIFERICSETNHHLGHSIGIAIAVYLRLILGDFSQASKPDCRFKQSFHVHPYRGRLPR